LTLDSDRLAEYTFYRRVAGEVRDHAEKMVDMITCALRSPF
jgi:hypothetical protein